MLPPNFIEILCRNSRRLLNSAHIVSIEQKEIHIADSNLARAKELGVEGDTAYYIYIAMSLPEQGREYLCKSKAERNAMFDSIAADLNPLVFTPNGMERLQHISASASLPAAQ